MKSEQFELVRRAALNLLAHRDAGRKCDPEAIRWAEQIVRANPAPIAHQSPTLSPAIAQPEVAA